MRNVVHGPSAKTIVKIVLSTAIILTTFYFAYAQSKPKTIDVNGRTRSYYLHVPSTYDGRTPVPLVLVLHGATQHAQGIERMSGMSAKADEQNFIAVYPAGTGFAPTWNAGNCCGYAQRNKVDDIDFLRVLIEKLKTEYNIDAKRVYATGISNGGMMSYRLACELADQIAAIGPVEGAQNITCNPSAPVSVIVFHGTADRLVPYDGGQAFSGVGPTETPVADTVAFWVKRNGCRPVPEHADDKGVKVDTYAGCEKGTGVALYTVEGGRHMWPGAKMSRNHVPSTDLIWAFFAAHPKP